MPSFQRQGRLVVILVIVGLYFVVELVTGYMLSALTLVSDAFHMMTDFAALLVALYAIRIAKRERTMKLTYGWARAEILGALVNTVFLIGLMFTVFIEAIHRFFEPEEITNPKLVLIVGSIGAAINIVGMVLLWGSHGHSHGGGGHGHSHGGGHGEEEEHGHSHDKGDHGHSHGTGDHGHAHESGDHGHAHESGDHGHAHESGDHGHAHGHEEECHSHEKNDTIEGGTKQIELTIEPGINIEEVVMSEKEKRAQKMKGVNMRAAFLHVVGDFLGSILVIITGLALWLRPDVEELKYLDPALSMALVIIIMWSAVPLAFQSAYILLQTVPSTVDPTKLQNEILQVRGVRFVHDLHIWQLTDSKLIASCHIICDANENLMKTSSSVKSIFHNYGIHATTVQPEYIDAPDATPEESDTCKLICETEACSTKLCCTDGRRRKTTTPTE